MTGQKNMNVTALAKVIRKDWLNEIFLFVSFHRIKKFPY